MTNAKKSWLILIILILIGGIIPTFHYWYLVGRVPGVTPLEAREELDKSSGSVLLVDVRSREKFGDRHVDGAQNWPYEEITALSPANGIPAPFIGKTLLLVCDGGIFSARATQRLRGVFGADALNVRGGIQAWVASADKPGGVEVQLVSASGEKSAAFRASPLSEQLALSNAALVINPLSMLVSLLLIIVLWRLKSLDMVALRWGLTFFLTGESFCALNIVIFNHSSYLFEFFHMYGMVLSFGFVTYAVLEAVDVRMLNYSDPQKRCLALSLCRQCAKYAEVPCGLRRSFYFVIPALIALALMPLLASTSGLSYNTRVFGLFYNYSHPVVYQLFETRYSPVYAMVFLAASLLTLSLKTDKSLSLVKVLFAAGVGPLAFSFLRLGFFGIYHDNLVWPNFWEELTELMYVTGVGFVLWLFRRGLFPSEKPPARL